MKNSTEQKVLTAKQLVVLQELVTNSCIQAVAEKTGVAKNTIYTWMQQEIFTSKLDTMRDKLLDETLKDLKAQSRLALTKLMGLLQSENETIIAKIATYIIDKAIEAKTTQEFEARIKVLEAKLVASEKNDDNQVSPFIKSA
jgi:transposase-like protein